MKSRKVKKSQKILEYFCIGLAVFTFGLLAYLIATLIIDGSFSLEWTAERLVQEGEDYCGSDIISENRGVAFIGYNCTTDNKVFKGILDCTGRYALFFDRTEEGWIPAEKKVIW